MKRIIVVLASLAVLNVSLGSGIVADSTRKGILFERGLSWQKVLEMARLEKKYIFVDCYASWCGPCKEMDREVYGLSQVGDAYNDRFICVRMQMDRTSQDDEMVKASYNDVKWITDRYRVNAYPTFLYFTSDGRIVKRAIGAMDAETFIHLADETVNPKLDYYALLNRFEGGVRDIPTMEFLANTAISFGDTGQATRIGAECVRCIEKKESLNSEDIGFIRQYTKGTKDFGFELFYRFGDSVNRLMMDDTYAQGTVAGIIMKEMVNPLINDSEAKAPPNWTAIQTVVESKFNRYYAQRAVDAARTNWFLNRKDYKEWIANYVRFEDDYGPKTNFDMWTAFALNKAAWAVFTYSSDSSELEHALSWSGRAVLMFPEGNLMDTYANLLYELGRKAAALHWELTAAKLAPNNKEVQERLEKIKAGLPTWPDRK